MEVGLIWYRFGIYIISKEKKKLSFLHALLVDIFIAANLSQVLMKCNLKTLIASKLVPGTNSFRRSRILLMLFLSWLGEIYLVSVI